MKEEKTYQTSRYPSLPKYDCLFHLRILSFLAFPVDSHHLNLFNLPTALKYHICLLLITGVHSHEVGVAVALSAKWASFNYEGQKIILNLSVCLLLLYKPPSMCMLLCIMFLCLVEFVTLACWG